MDQKCKVTDLFVKFCTESVYNDTIIVHLYHDTLQNCLCVDWRYFDIPNILKLIVNILRLEVCDTVGMKIPWQRMNLSSAAYPIKTTSFMAAKILKHDERA